MLKNINLRMPIEHNESDLKTKVAKTLRLKVSQLKTFKIARQSIDARNKKYILQLLHFC